MLDDFPRPFRVVGTGGAFKVVPDGYPRSQSVCTVTTNPYLMQASPERVAHEIAAALNLQPEVVRALRRLAAAAIADFGRLSDMQKAAATVAVELVHKVDEAAARAAA